MAVGVGQGKDYLDILRNCTHVSGFDMFSTNFRDGTPERIVYLIQENSS